MSNASPKARRTHRVYSLEFKQQVVQETLEPGTSVSVVARRHDMNANVVFEWKRLYREDKLKLPGIEATPTSSAELLPINVIDLPVPMPRPAQPVANESPSTAANAPPSVCEIEVEIGKRRVRIRGLPLERAELFLQECLK
ncbi:IS66-like element accessory protein TnpA [Paraburkholderia tropica]|uniref:IS66-like element accessory protein TnpA n=1 Tax=Paraburkholderia tropica TaxID=92647 RepID=UPI0022856BAA|nr:transposase [Paraburkholderia tropica]